jgi:hypothetical protein
MRGQMSEKTTDFPAQKIMPLQTKSIGGSESAAQQNNTRPIPEKVREFLNTQQNGKPEWIRPPKQGVEFYCGFSRARLYQGAKDGDFRSVSIRKPGQTKGTRLFHLQSILDFIANFEQAADSSQAAKSMQTPGVSE